MSDQIALDVRKLPFWDNMHKDVTAIVKAGAQAPKGESHDRSAAMLAAIVVKHLAAACAIIGTDEAEAFFALMLDLASMDEYPKDDDSKLDPQDPSDPSAQWDNRRAPSSTQH